MSWLFISLAVFANVGGSLLLKTASDAKSDNSLLQLINVNYLIAAFSYFLSFVFYALALKKMPLGLAQPISTAVPIVVVGIYSYLALKEHYGPASIAGLLLILAGIILLALGKI